MCHGKLEKDIALDYTLRSREVQYFHLSMFLLWIEDENISSDLLRRKLGLSTVPKQFYSRVLWHSIYIKSKY